jgi:two-component sensor histidine kinase
MTAVPLRVLYIDDDEALAYLVARHLKREGLAIETVLDGESGLARLRESTFDAVALDHFMPGLGGMEVLAHIRAMPEPPPVIYVTAADEGRVAISALKSGAADYVIKGVENEFLPLLVAAITSAVAARETLRQKQVADDEMRRAREKAELLLREMNHRVANSLSLVASMVRLQANQTVDEASRGALQDTHSRIIAIAQLHRSLYTSDDVRTVEMDPYLHTLLDELRRSQAAKQLHAINAQFDNLSMTPDTAVSVGVVVSELVTNALKYAYPRDAEGEIRVSLRSAPDGWCLSVEDDGVGWQSGQPQGTGLGMQIVKAMAATLHGELHVEGGPTGTRIALTTPNRPAPI